MKFIVTRYIRYEVEAKESVEAENGARIAVMENVDTLENDEAKVKLMGHYWQIDVADTKQEEFLERAHSLVNKIQNVNDRIEALERKQ
jgi:hypothetical protein